MLHRPTDVGSATTTMQLVTELAALGRLISMEKEDREVAVQELRGEIRVLSEQVASSKNSTDWGTAQYLLKTGSGGSGAVTPIRASSVSGFGGGVEQDHAAHFASIQERLEQEQLARELGHRSLREFLEELGQSVAEKLKAVEAQQLQQGSGTQSAPDLQLREECAQMFQETMSAHEALTAQLRDEMAAIMSVQEEVHATHRSTFGRHRDAIEAVQAMVADVKGQRSTIDDTFAPQGAQNFEVLEAALKKEIMQVSMDQKAGQAALRDLVLSHRGELDAGYAGISGAHRAQLEAVQQLRTSVSELASKTSPQTGNTDLEALTARMREEIGAQLARFDGGSRPGADAHQRAALEALETRLQVELGRLAGDHRAAVEALDSRCRESIAGLAREQQTWMGSLGSLRAPAPREEGIDRQRVQELEQNLRAEFAQASSDHQEVSLSVLRDLLAEHKASSGEEQRGTQEELDARLSTQIARVAQEQLQVNSALNELDNAVKQEFAQISRDSIQFKAIVREQAADVERRLAETKRPQDGSQEFSKLEVRTTSELAKMEVRLAEEIARVEGTHVASHSTLWDCVMSHKTMLDDHASVSEQLSQEQLAREAERGSLAVVLEELDRRMESMRDSAQERKTSQSQVLEELDRRFDEEATRRRTEVQAAVADHASSSERQVQEIYLQVQQDIAQRDERSSALRADIAAVEARLREEIARISLADTVQLSHAVPLQAPAPPQARPTMVYAAAPPSSNGSSVTGTRFASTEGPHVWPAGQMVTYVQEMAPAPFVHREVSSTQASQAGSAAAPPPQVIHRPTIILPQVAPVAPGRQAQSPGAVSRAISLPAAPVVVPQAVLSAVPTASSIPRRAGSSSPVPQTYSGFAGFAGGQRSPRASSRPPARAAVAQQVRISTSPRPNSPQPTGWQRDQSPWRAAGGHPPSRSPSRPVSPAGRRPPEPVSRLSSEPVSRLEYTPHATGRSPQEPVSRFFSGPGLLGNGLERDTSSAIDTPLSSSLVAPSFRSLNKCLSLLDPGPTAAKVSRDYEDVPTRPASRSGRRGESGNGDEP